MNPPAPGPEAPFDLLVIGGGSGGVRAARLAAQRGQRVALVEARHLGGTCVNVGCVPKKLYHYAASHAHGFEEAPGYGWSWPDSPQPPRPVLDWGLLKQRRAAEVDRLRGVYEDNLRKAHVRILRGWASFLGADAVEVEGQVLRARHIVIAAGAQPVVPDLPGKEWGVTSDAMFDLAEFPRRLAVVGGGYIACEMASIFRGLGAQVTLLQRGRQLLNGFDTEVAQHLARELERQGIRIEREAETTALDHEASGLRHVHWKDAQGRAQVLEADVVLLATGRRPAVAEALGLARAGVALDAKGRIQVDDQGQTSQRGIHAIGDVCTRKPLTPIAIAEAAALVDRLFGPAPNRPARRVAYEFTPTAVFTHPGVASVGYSEEAARERFQGIDVYRSDFVGLKHALTGLALRTLVKLVVERASDRVIGLHLVAEDAGEIVQGFAVAMNAGATKADFDDTVGLHPTVAEELVSLKEPARQYP